MLVSHYQEIKKQLYDKLQQSKKHKPKLNDYKSDPLAESVMKQQPSVGTYNPPMLQSPSAPQFSYRPIIANSSVKASLESTVNLDDTIKPKKVHYLKKLSS
jgi:hypothetical protein